MVFKTTAAPKILTHKNRSGSARSHWVNYSALWELRPPRSRHNMESVVVTIAPLFHLDVVEAAKLGSGKADGDLKGFLPEVIMQKTQHPHETGAACARCSLVQMVWGNLGHVRHGGQVYWDTTAETQQNNSHWQQSVSITLSVVVFFIIASL